MDVVAAVQQNDLVALRGLLKADPALANARTPQGLSLLQLACYQRFQPGIDALLAAGAQPDAWAAAALGDAPRLRALVEADRNVLEAPGPDGFPALHLAAHFGHVEALRALLDLGASPGLVGGPPLANTALHAALAGRQREAARLLLAAGAPVDAPDHGGNTPVHLAAAVGDEEIVALLDQMGADLDARNAKGQTPYDLARERDDARLAAYLAPR